MAGEQNHDLALVPFVATSQDLLHVDQKQVLSASLFMHINQSDAPIYRFVQQPMRLFMPLGTLMDHQNQLQDPTDPEHMNRLAIVPFSHNKVSADQTKPCMNNEIVVWQGQVADETPNAPEVVSQLPYTDRKQNWIIRRLPRKKVNVFDSYHVHLQTDRQFRSLAAAHQFIVHGRFPKPQVKREKGENDTQKSTSRRGIVRGDKLLDRVEVGYYNLTTGEIFRGGVPPPGSRGIGNKRKREDGTSGHEMQGRSQGGSRVVGRPPFPVR
ncbi:hypothetical protein CASFOL_019929 [Castilleja foliolosa]|uniref:Uncharacterized protein n=1 Tax=Castilleja foliolosa TaxID=1961234 RepID=A0ABD3D093_9LAMI